MLWNFDRNFAASDEKRRPTLGHSTIPDKFIKFSAPEVCHFTSLRDGAGQPLRKWEATQMARHQLICGCTTFDFDIVFEVWTTPS